MRGGPRIEYGADLSIDDDHRYQVATRVPARTGMRGRSVVLIATLVLLSSAFACGEDEPTSSLRELPVRPATPAPGQEVENLPARTPPVDVPDAIPGTRITAFSAPNGKQLVGRSFGEKYDRSKGVLILHRSTSNMREWQDFGTRLMGEGYAVITFDFPGYGESEGPRDPKTYPDAVEAAFDLLQIYGVTQVAIVGDEVGGTAALGIDPRYQGVLQGIVTIGSAPTFESLDVTEQAKQLNDRVLVLDSSDNGLAKLCPEGDFEQLDPGASPASNTAVTERVHGFIVDAIGRA